MCSDLSSLLLSDRRVVRVAASVGSSSGATGWIIQVSIILLAEIFDFLEWVVSTVRCSPCVVLVLLSMFLLVSKVNVRF